MISGLGKVGTCDERTLETAKENLVRSFGVVGPSVKIPREPAVNDGVFCGKFRFMKITTSRKLALPLTPGRSRC